MSLADPYEIEVNEQSSLVYTATLTDEDDAPIASASVTSIRMTLIETVSGDVVNSRSAQSVFNANNCTMHATSGLFTWSIQPEDTEIIGDGADGYETHLATVTVAWGSNKKMHREILLKIRNLRSIV